jgi:diguanylate cyclase (GGDEF)-like protein
MIQNGAQGNKILAVLILDLDRFRGINNALSNRVGDLLLEQVAERLRGMLRKSDTFARIGDDEFALLMPTMNIGHTRLAASKIQSIMEPPFLLDGQQVTVKASIGIALSPQHGTDADRLMQYADGALAVAKRAGSRFIIYDKQEKDSGVSHFSLEAELQGAIGEGELAVYYQPKINVKSRQISGLEALVRWNSPKRGFMPPDEFIPVAEQTGLIQPLTLWVLNAALRQSVAFADKGVDLTIAVNLSPRNLDDAELPALVLRAMDTWGAAPSRLILEITENAIMEDPAHALEILHRFTDMGISISIDDFGTGYSSLAYLKKLPVNELKIDKSFVMNMVEEKDDAMIVRSVIELARNFGLNAVAEGVKNERAWEILADLGCDHAQGYYISPPVPIEKLNKWMVESPWGLDKKGAQ